MLVRWSLLVCVGRRKKVLFCTRPTFLPLLVEKLSDQHHFEMTIIFLSR